MASAEPLRLRSWFYVSLGDSPRNKSCRGNFLKFSMIGHYCVLFREKR